MPKQPFKFNRREAEEIAAGQAARTLLDSPRAMQLFVRCARQPTPYKLTKAVLVLMSGRPVFDSGTGTQYTGEECHSVGWLLRVIIRNTWEQE